MAQVPATPKLQRLKLLGKARLADPIALSQTDGLQTSEIAALKLRAALAKQPALGKAEQVIFLIPLVSPQDVTDWNAVTGRLDRTLHSFLNQTNPNWRAVICCQERPPLPDDTRITYLPFDEPFEGNDKWRKLHHLADSLNTHTDPASYVMSFDADDLLHHGAVDHMLRQQAQGGYLVEQGFVRDVATSDIGLAGRPTLAAPLRKPFWKLCGSCVALRYAPDMIESATFIQAMTQHEHRMFPYLAKLAGLPLTVLPEPMVLYELNHGENFGERRGRVSFKTRFVQRFKITDQTVLSGIERSFPQ